jgi:hypothetical protein
LREFSDIDVAILVLALSVKEFMRDSDYARLRDYIYSKFGMSAESIMGYLNAKENEDLKKRFYLMHRAMATLRMSVEEKAVSFVDLLGMAGTLVGFSGTMGTSIEAPEYQDSADRRRAYSGWGVLTIEDKKNNDYVDWIISNADLIFVHGEPGTDRAREVIRRVSELINKDKRQACIVDGSGEFGVFQNDVDAIAQNWEGGLATKNLHLEYFNSETGRRTNIKTDDIKRTVLYYSHRNSRGTDGEMPAQTIGLTIMSLENSPRRDIAQAIFRLRKLDKGQQAMLVVVSKEEVPTPARAGSAVLARLVQNERKYAASADDVKSTQMEHAAKYKQKADDFMRTVVYKELASVNAQKQQEQQAETQTQVQGEKRETKTLQVNDGTHCHEKTKDATVDYDTVGLLNRETHTSIQDSLKIANLGLSPMMTISDLTKGNDIRRAFAIDDSNQIVVIAIVEVWAKYKATGTTSGLSYYTHDGELIMGAPNAPEGAVLFGRFLCNDELSIEEEITLLRYLERRYHANERSAIMRVLKCLFDSNFISSQSFLLKELSNIEAGAILERASGDTDALINKVAGDDAALEILIAPIIRRALGAKKQSFGSKPPRPPRPHRPPRPPRPPRPMRSFV